MRELINDSFYDLIKTYKRCVMDYCLIEDDTPYQGYRSHKDAILFAMCKVMERYIEEQLRAEIDFNKGRPEDLDEEPFPWRLDLGKAKAKLINPAAFLYVPDCSEKGNGEASAHNTQIPYWYAFLKTPHGNGYGTDDFAKINRTLFPNGTDSLDVYEWTTDWSNYFAAGHEWWGAACWSVYDRSLNRYVVLLASTTD